MSNNDPTMRHQTTTKRRKASWLAAFSALALALAALMAPFAQAGTTRRSPSAHPMPPSFPAVMQTRRSRTRPAADRPARSSGR